MSFYSYILKHSNKITLIVFHSFLFFLFPVLNRYLYTFDSTLYFFVFRAFVSVCAKILVFSRVYFFYFIRLIFKNISIKLSILLSILLKYLFLFSSYFIHGKV